MASLLTKLKPNRRWLQVSLRTVLVLITLLCVALSMWVVPAERQRRAVAVIRTQGGGIVFRMQPTSELLRRWLPLTYLYEVEMVCLNDNQVTDAAVAHLQELTSLRRLRLDNSQVTDAGLVHLRRLTCLQVLDLSNTQITDAGVNNLQRALPDCQIMGP